MDLQDIGETKMNKDNTGVLFINQKSNDRQPDFKGEVTIKGVKYELAGWNNQSDKGTKYISLVAKEK